MNRTVAYLGVATCLAGLALASFPIVVTGHELFDVEQESGFLVAPVGLVVVMLAFTLHDPRQTTVAGAFGNPEEERHRRPEPLRPAIPSLGYNPRETAICRYCRTNIEFDQANCPRCARARECRSCGRPLGYVLDRATCPRCARAEALCNCPMLTRAPSPAPLAVRARRG
jgi:hypothetical protein